MNEVDKIARETKTLLESVKDSFVTNIVNAAHSKTVQLDERQLEGIVAIANISFDEGYQRAIPFFQRSIKNQLEESKRKK